MGHDGAMVGYLRRLFGYAMLGVPKQELAVFHGTGRNGKSTLLTLMREVFGGYARQTGAEVVMERRNEGIPNDIARLAGARLVTASETRDGNRLNAARIKSLLGGEPVTARYLHKEFFEFLPQFLLVLGTNHKPIIDGADFGLMRRLQLVPFEVVIPPERVDPLLMDKLRGEKPGILAWLVRGCLAYQAGGLEPPEKVRAATAEYGAEMDTIGLFLEERVMPKADGQIEVERLFDSYWRWCISAWLKSIALPAFGRKRAKVKFGG
jgi:putative DNA primase/helicase